MFLALVLLIMWTPSIIVVEAGMGNINYINQYIPIFFEFDQVNLRLYTSNV